jgi:hypothetical protein
MMTFAHAQKYFWTILALTCDCSRLSSKNRSVAMVWDSPCLNGELRLA